ncbi:MAG: hypothetical protein RBR45_12470 [Pseudomonas sp.]|nr:hypothetical protein [Pseudomonas sp.]
MFKILSRMVFLTVIIGVSACAGIQHKTNDERVFSLAEKRQAALLKQDFDKAYAFMSPGYREVNTIKQFMGDNQGVYSWISSKVDKAECEDDVCKVYVEIEFDARALMGGVGKPSSDTLILSRVNRETWVKLDNKWWFSKSE